jgi:hypothetical protein
MLSDNTTSRPHATVVESIRERAARNQSTGAHRFGKQRLVNDDREPRSDAHIELDPETRERFLRAKRTQQDTAPLWDKETDLLPNTSMVVYQTPGGMPLKDYRVYEYDFIPHTRPDILVNTTVNDYLSEVGVCPDIVFIHQSLIASFSERFARKFRYPFNGEYCVMRSMRSYVRFSVYGHERLPSFVKPLVTHMPIKRAICIILPD